MFQRVRFFALAVCLLVSGNTALAQSASKDNGEAVSWPSILCRGPKCEPLTAKGWLFAKPGMKNVVIISHGSDGIDYRVFDRVDHLNQAGFAALVIDHWGSRGLSAQTSDLKGAPQRGATEFNMASDIYTAASMLRKERGFEHVGSIGGSGGGGAQIMVQQKWAMQTLEKTYEYWYKKPFVARPLDAQVGLYAFCGYRNKLRDAFNGVPLLLISGSDDDMTPPEYCQRIVSWMNERGGHVSYAEVKGGYHAFDGRDGPHRILVKHMGACDLMVDEKGITNLKTGDLTTGEYSAALVQAIDKCGNTLGFMAGTRGDSQAAVPMWIDFFKKYLD